MSYHNPVMLQECIEGLNINPDGIYVDVTFGGGGHSKAILEKLSDKGRLYAFDQDEDALSNGINDPRFRLISENFRYMNRWLKLYKITEVDGILADFGISSYQIDTAERGFSFMRGGPLDMRMDQTVGKSAKDVIRDYEEGDLADVLYRFGDLKESRKIARNIVHLRKEKPFETTEELALAVEPYFHPRHKNQGLARVFQALRIEVNDELGVIEDFLPQTAEIIKPKGRLVAMSYHSLEDRLVKNYIKNGLLYGEPERDIYGRYETPFTAVNRKVIVPSEEEIASNPRAKSAKLRIAERNENK